MDWIVALESLALFIAGIIVGYIIFKGMSKQDLAEKKLEVQGGHDTNN